MTVLLVLALASSVPLAAASGHLTAELDETHRTAAPGDAVTFGVIVTNNDSEERSVAFTVDADVDWRVDTDPAAGESVTVPAGGSRTLTARVHVPEDAAAGSVVPFNVTVEETGSLALVAWSAALAFEVEVREPATGASASPAHASFTLTSESTDLEAEPGAAATAGARLVVERARDTAGADLRAVVPDGWPASAAHVRPAQTAFFTGMDRDDIVLTVTVPEDADVNATYPVTLRAIPWDGSPVREVAFTLTVLPPSAPAGNESAHEEASAPGGEDTSTENEDTNASAPDAEPEPAAPPALTLTLDADALTLRPGGTATSTARLVNPDSDARDVALDAVVADGWVVAFERDEVTVPAAGEVSVGFTLLAPADAEPGATLEATLLAGDASAPLTLNVEAAPAATPGDAVTNSEGDAMPGDEEPTLTPLDAVIAEHGVGPVVAAAGALALVGGAVYLRGAPDVRRHLWWIGIGLYTRLTRPKLLDHAERERLYTTINEQPGIHFHALQRTLGWNTGALTYHLRVLERHQMITSRRDGIRRRFYVVGQAPRTMPKAVTSGGREVHLSGLRGSVMRTVREQGPVSQADLAEALGTSKQSVNYHVKTLERLGLLRVERVGRETVLHPVADVDVEGMDAQRTPAGAVALSGGPGRAVADGDDDAR